MTTEAPVPETTGFPGAVLLVVTALFLFWLFAWPLFFDPLVHMRGSVPRFLRNHIGTIILLFVGGSALGLWIASVTLTEGVGWRDIDAQVGSLAIAGAVAFTYGSLIPPAASPRFYRILNVETGEWEPETHLKRLCVSVGKTTPVMLGVWNVGISSWSSYRIHVDFPEKRFEVFIDHEDLTPERWDWSPQSPLFHGMNRPWVQVETPNSLSPGEPHVVRFGLRASSPGTFPVTITVGSSGRFGETRRRVHVDVSVTA